MYIRSMFGGERQPELVACGVGSARQDCEASIASVSTAQAAMSVIRS